MKSIQSKLFYLPIVIFPIILFSSAIFGAKALFWGTPALQFIPWHSLAIDILKSGDLPLWNPFNGAGVPLAANYQSALFYPPNWLALLAGWIGGDGLLAWIHTLLIALHLIWMGLGMVCLMKYLGFNRMSQVISALAFSLSGYFVARAGFFSMIWTSAWMPWVFYAASKITFPGQELSAQKGFPVNSGLAFYMGLQLLAGHAQLTWYTWLMLIAWLTIGGWGLDHWHGVFESLKRLLLPGLLALGFAAVQLLLTTEFLLYSQRSTSVNWDSAMTYSLWPWRLLGFLLPDLFGNPGAGNYWGYGSFWEDAVYIGVLPFLLSVFTIPIIWKKESHNIKNVYEKKLIIFLWIFTFISIVMALGKNTPVFLLLYKYIPTFNMFNSPARYLIWAIFSMSILAGIGYDYWLKPKGKSLYWLRLGTAAGFAITLGAFIAWILLKEISITIIRSIALCGLFMLIAGILTILQPETNSHGKVKIWQYAVIVFIGFDLCIINSKSIPLINLSFYNDTKKSSLISEGIPGRMYLSPCDEYYIKFNRFLQFESYEIEEEWNDFYSIMVPNLNIFYKIPSINNFDPLVTQRYRKFMDYVNSLPFDERHSWFNLLDVTMVEKRSRDEKLGVTINNVEGSRKLWVFYCAEIVENEEIAWQELKSNINFSSGIETESSIIIEDSNNAGESCNSPGNYQINNIVEKAGYLRIELTSEKPGWLMISESWYPGWIARINGEKTNIYPGDYLFQSVKFGQGHNIIELSYEPILFKVGVGISCLSLLLITIIYMIERKKFLKKG